MKHPLYNSAQTAKAKTKRFALSTAAATGVTMGLFLMMQQLSANDQIVLDQPKLVQMPKVVQEQPELKPIKKDQLEEMIEPVDVPDVIVEQPRNKPNTPTYTPSAPSTIAGEELDATPDLTGSSGGVMIIAAVQPVYPRTKLQQGAEGYCLVSVTVTESGSVDPDSVIVTEESQGGGFKRACMQAIKKFKFKPAVEKGQPVSVENVTYRFVFNLEK